MKKYIPKDVSIAEIKRIMRSFKSRHTSRKKKAQKGLQVAHDLSKCFRVSPFEPIAGQDN